MSKAEDVRAAWLDEPITYRQFLTEQALLAEEVSWAQASAATDQVLARHPDIDGDRLRPRGEWKV